MSTAVPAKLGKYEIRGTLGRGAMGTVYDGWDPVIQRRVAIKTVRLPEANDVEGTEGLDRFKREAQAAGRLTHPNVVGVFDYGETDEVAYIVMEFVSGRSLKEMLDAELRLPLGEIIRLMGEILAGLAYSHGSGVVHRDIKPANIMVTNDVGQAKIADFGIARIEASSMTQAGTVMGTPAYMSPEQFMGQVVDQRTDIYSCGILLYQMLTGERPFEGSMSSIMHKAMTTTPPAPSELAVTSPRMLDAVVARAMARRPEDRFATAAEFAAALRTPAEASVAPIASAGGDADATIVTSPPVASTPTPTPVAVAAAKPNRTPVIAAAAGVLLLAAGAGAYLLRTATPVTVPTSTPVAAPVIAPTAAIPATPPLAPAITEAVPPRQTPQAATAPDIVAPSTAPPAVIEPPQRQAAIVVPLLPTPAPSATPVMAPPSVDPASIPCSLVQSTPLGTTALAGTQSETAVQQATTLQPRIVAEPFCAVLDQLRALPKLAASDALALGQVGGPAPLLDEQTIAVEAVMPAFASYLQVVYIQPDRTVAILVPGAGYSSQSYPAHGRLTLGTPHSGFPGWQVGPPFGTDMIVALASTAPLFQKPPPETQSLDAYLAAVQTAVDALRRRGGSVGAAAIPIETRPAR